MEPTQRSLAPPRALLRPAAVLRARAVRRYDAFPVLVGPPPVPVGAVDGAQVRPEDLAVAAAGLPTGPATAEAVAVRLRRSGWETVTAGPGPGPGADRLTDLVRAERRRGRAAVGVWRVAPDLLPELELGSWTAARWSARVLRRALLPVVQAVAVPVERRCPPADSVPARALRDAAFWAGVRDAATAGEWARLTSSYTALCYHRVAGEGVPGQESLDLPPARLRTQLLALRLLRYRPLALEELLALHAPDAAPSRRWRRRFVLTLDDAFADAVDAAVRHRWARPHVYVPTAALGRPAAWAAGAPAVAGEGAVRAARAAGVEVGGHGRSHVPLAGLDDERLHDEVAGSREDLAALVRDPLPALAYPNGRHDRAAREAARAAGYRLAWTTAPGRNGAGTDPWCLRRTGPHELDSLPAFLYKVVTGELLPARWERRLVRRHERRTGRPAKPRP